MDQKKKRLSILKKSVRYESSPTQTFTKSNRRISFSGTKSVKEFIAGEDKATIWGTSYEEEDGNHGSAVSPQDTCNAEASTIFTNSSSYGMTLRNRKIIPTIVATDDKENVAIDNTYDTMDLANTQNIASLNDNRTFNGTLDITLNSFEIRNLKFIKTGFDERTRKETKAEGYEEASAFSKRIECEPDLSQNFCCSFISEEDRKLLLQNRIASARDGNNKSGSAQINFNRQVLVDKNLGKSLNMSLEAMRPSQDSNNSNGRKTIVFQQGEMIELNENSSKTVDSTKTRKTLLFDEELVLDTSIMEKPKINEMQLNQNMLPTRMTRLNDDRMVIDDKESMDRTELDVKNKRKTIIFRHGEEISCVEVDNQATIHVELDNRNNNPDRKTIVFHKGETMEPCVEQIQTKFGNGPMQQKSRQTLVFDGGERIDDDAKSVPAMCSSTKRMTQVFPDMEMEVEPSTTTKTLPIPTSETSPIASSFSFNESLGGQNISLSVFNKIQQTNKNSVLLTNDSLDETLKDPNCTLQNSNPIKREALQSAHKTNDTSIELPHTMVNYEDIDISFEIPATRNESSNSKNKNRKTIVFQEGEMIDTSMVPSTENLQNKANSTVNKDEMYSPRQDKEENMSVFQNKNESKMCADSRKTIVFQAGDAIITESKPTPVIFSSCSVTNLTLKRSEARKTTVFDSGEPIEGSDNDAISCVMPINVGAVSRTQERKTILFQKGESIMECEDEISLSTMSAKKKVHKLGNEKFEFNEKHKHVQDEFQGICEGQEDVRSRKTRIFHRGEPLDEVEVDENQHIERNSREANRTTVDRTESRKTRFFDRGEPIKDVDFEINTNISGKQVPTSNVYNHRSELRKTRIFQHGEAIEEIKFQNIKNFTQHDKDVRNTIWLSEDLEESGLALEIGKKDQRKITDITRNQQIASSDENMEIDISLSEPQLETDQRNTKFQRKTMIFSTGENINDMSCVGNVEHGAKSLQMSNVTTNISLFTDESQQACDNVSEQHKYEFPYAESRKDSQLNISEQDANVGGAQTYQQYMRRKTYVFEDENIEIEPETNFEKGVDKENVEHETISPDEFAQQRYLSKLTSSRIPKKINDIKSAPEGQYVGHLPKTMKTTQEANMFMNNKGTKENRLETRFNVLRPESQRINDKSNANLQSHLKCLNIERMILADVKEGDSDIDLSLDIGNRSKWLPSTSEAHTKSQRKTIVFQNGEQIEMSGSARNLNISGRHQEDLDVPSVHPNRTKNCSSLGDQISTKSQSSVNTKDVTHHEVDISIDKSLDEIQGPTFKKDSKRKTLIFTGGGEDIEEEIEQVENNINGISLHADKIDAPDHLPSTLKELELSNDIPSCRKALSFIKTAKSEHVEHNQNRNAWGGDMEIEYQQTVKAHQNPNFRKTVIIENSPAKNLSLCRDMAKDVEISPADGFKNLSDISICQGANEKENVLDEPFSRLERQTTEITNHRTNNRKTIYLHEDIGDAMEISICSLPQSSEQSKQIIEESSKRTDQSSKNNKNPSLETQNTFVLCPDVSNEYRELPFNKHEANNRTDKCADASPQAKRGTFTIRKEVESENVSKTSDVVRSDRGTFVIRRESGNNGMEIRDLAHSSTKKSFENNSSTTIDVHPRLFQKLTQDSVYLSRTANGPVGGIDSFQATGSSFTFSANSTAALCNIDPNQITGAGYKRTYNKNYATDDTFYKQFKRDYEEITIDTIRESPNQYLNLDSDANEDIDKTRIDLVDTVETIEDSPEKIEVCEASVMILNVTEANRNVVDLKSITITKEQQKSLCHKCKNCQRTILNETTLAGFNLEKNLPELELNFDSLKKLEGKPRFRDVWNEFKERRLSSCFNSTYEESSLFPTVPSAEFLLNNYAEGYLQKLEDENPTTRFIGAECPIIPPFGLLFQNRLKEKSDWSFDDINLPIGVLECRHKSVRGVRIVLRFDPQDLHNPNISQLNFNQVLLVKCNIYRNPSPFDKAVQNEIFLRVSRDLTAFCCTSSHLFTFLEDLHQLFIKSQQLVKNLLRDVFSNYALFQYDESDNCVIRKVVCNDSLPTYGHKIEFIIRVRNIEKMCADDILLPPRSYFKDDIKTIPPGLKFIKSFLPNPAAYLK